MNIKTYEEYVKFLRFLQLMCDDALIQNRDIDFERYFEELSEIKLKYPEFEKKRNNEKSI